MGVNNSQIRLRERIFTSHGTVVFVDPESGELRHGSADLCPANVAILHEGERARLRFVAEYNQADIVCLPEYSAVVGSGKMRTHGTAHNLGTTFLCVGVAREFALKQNEQFLSAEPDGRITLSRPICRDWERFHSRAEASGALVEQMKWSPVHGATLRSGDDGDLILRDGSALDWHLVRWTDSRLDGACVKLSIVAKPADTCDTNLYVHHWGGKDVCSIDKNGITVSSEGAKDVQVNRLTDGYFAATITFENRHPTLSFGTGKPSGRYHGGGVDQYLLKSIEVELLPLNSVRQTLINKIWKASDPFHDLPENLIAHDLQGWNSQHPYLSDAIAALRPSMIVEIGVWKGGSTVFMANELKKHGMSSAVIAVDTWLGSSEHWLGESNAKLNFFNGRPDLYYKFLSNVVHAQLTDYVVPLPLDSLNAAQVIKSLRLNPQMIHLDGGHDYDSVLADLRAWWPTLAPGGIFIGDDYYINGAWPGVRGAFDDFFSALDLTPIENVSGKCRVRKPGEGFYSEDSVAKD